MLHFRKDPKIVKYLLIITTFRLWREERERERERARETERDNDII